MSFWSALKIGASALSAQRLRLDVIANNVANAETTRTENGEPYQRRDVVFSTPSKVPFISSLIMANRNIGEKALNLNGVKVTQIVTDDDPGPRVYDPSHPDADEEGFVTYPNVNMVVEMTNMLSATRSYEASLSVIDAARQMAQKALEIGR